MNHSYPAIEVNTVLFDISGTGADSTVILPTTKKALIRPSGSVSDIKLVKQGDEQTVTLHVSGAATNIQVAKDYENTNLFNFSGEMRQGIPVYTPSWISPKGDQSTEEYDWGLITATPTQQSEDWGPINTNDETIPKEAENWGFLLPAFNYVQIGGQHYPQQRSYILSWERLHLPDRLLDLQNSNVPTFRRSQYCVCNFLRVFW